MKSKNPFLFSWLFAGILLMSTGFTACDKDDDDEDNRYTLSGPASGTQERPTPVTTTATGTISGTYNDETMELDYTITWTGLTGGNPTMMHFHGPAGPEEVAPPVVDITGFTPTPSGTVSNKVTLTEEQETQLLGGRWYYNIHNPTYPAGEIRGQITAGR